MANVKILTVVVAAAVVLWNTPMLGQKTDQLAFHDLRAMTPTVRGVATLWPVVTDTASLFTGEIAEVFNQAPHHHEQEQITFSVAGTFDVTIGGVSNPLPAFNAVIIPSNVPHFMTNKSGARARLLEYQPVARRDWLVVKAVIPPPPAPPATLNDAQTLTGDMSPGSAGWAVADNGARVKTFSGKTIRVRMLDVSAGTAAVDITDGAPRVQRFLYVFQGHATISAGSTKRQIDSEIYVEVAPSAENVIVSSTSGERTMVAVFEPVPR